MINEAKKLDKVFVAYENADGITLYDSLSKNANYTSIRVNPTAKKLRWMIQKPKKDRIGGRKKHSEVEYES